MPKILGSYGIPNPLDSNSPISSLGKAGYLKTSQLLVKCSMYIAGLDIAALPGSVNTLIVTNSVPSVFGRVEADMCFPVLTQGAHYLFTLAWGSGALRRERGETENLFQPNLAMFTRAT